MTREKCARMFAAGCAKKRASKFLKPAPLCGAIAIFFAGSTALRAQIAIQRGATAQSLNSSYSPVNYGSADFTSGAFTTPGGSLAVVPVGGLYNVAGALTMSGVSVIDGYVAVNGNIADAFFQNGLVGPNDEYSFSSLVQLNAGDNVSIRTRVSSGGSIAATPVSKSSLKYVGRPNAPTVVAVQREAPSQGLNSFNSPVLFGFVNVATGFGNVFTGSNVGSVPRAGLYNIAGSLTALSNASGGLVEGYISVNGNIYDRFYQNYSNGGTWQEITFSSLAQLQAGDTVSVFATAPNGGQISGSSYTKAGITYAGNPNLPSVAGIQRPLAGYQSFGSSYTPVNFGANTVSTGGFTTPAGSLAVVPKSGLYDISGALTARAFSGFGTVDGYIAINGNVYDSFIQTFTGGTWEEIGFRSLVSLSAGDTVSIFVRGGGELAGAQYSTANITRVVNPDVLETIVNINGNTAEKISHIGTVDVTGMTLSFAVTNASPGPLAPSKTFIIVDNDGADAVVGTFASIVPGALAGLLEYTVTYNYSGTAANGVGNGNDIAITFTYIPEPGSGVVAIALLSALGRRSRGQIKRASA